MARDPNRKHGPTLTTEKERPTVPTAAARKVQRIFRTLCVRLCDGYYFPVSSATPASRLQRDSKVCNQRCGMEGRLFIHHSPNGSVEDMVDLQGRPYRALGTAFLYRREYVASCKCQPDPWEPVSMERHRGYALALAARNGDTDAAQQLKALQERLQELAKHSQDGAAQSLAALNAAVQPAADPTDYNRKRRTSSGAPPAAIKTVSARRRLGCTSVQWDV